MAPFLLCILLSITFGQIVARPAASEIQGIILNNGSGQDKYNEFMFKFPKRISAGLKITIKGTINSLHSKLTLELPDAGVEKKHCHVVYDFKNKKIFSTNVPIDDFEFVPDNKAVFSLNIKARVGTGSNIFDVYFTGNEEYGFPVISCKITNFDNFSFLRIKEGAKKISELLFKFDENSEQN